MKFKHDVIMNGDRVEIVLEGFLNESSDLPIFPAAKQLIVNVDRVKMINSTGILVWIKWIKHYADVPTTIDRCRPAFVSAANTVRNFLPPKVTIKSLYVPYVSEDGGEEEEILISIPEGTVDLAKLVPENFTASDGKSFEADVRLENYLSFMKRLLAGNP